MTARTKSRIKIALLALGGAIIGLLPMLLMGQAGRPPVTTLDGLSDVVITSPLTGQSLLYNGTNWYNGPVPVPALSTLSDVGVVSPAGSQVLRWDGVALKWTNYGPLAFTDMTGVITPTMTGNVPSTGTLSSQVWRADGTWGAIPSAGTITVASPGNVVLGDGSGNGLDTVSSSPVLNMSSTGLAASGTVSGDFLINWTNSTASSVATAGVQLNVADGYSQIKQVSSIWAASGLISADDIWIRQHITPSGVKHANIDLSVNGGQFIFSNDDGVTNRVQIGNGLAVGTIADKGAGTVNAANGYFGKIIGTTTNDNAAAGAVGEFISANAGQGTAVTLSTGVAANVLSISLTAGDWDVQGNVDYIPGTTTVVTYTQQGSSSTSATLPAGFATSAFAAPASYTPGANVFGQTIPTQRYSLAGTTTVYLVAYSTFSTSTMKAFGYIQARRMR